MAAVAKKRLRTLDGKLNMNEHNNPSNTEKSEDAPWSWEKYTDIENIDPYYQAFREETPSHLQQRGHHLNERHVMQRIMH
jgi:hypothetical protein